jgi:hypothetical protein
MFELSMDGKAADIIKQYRSSNDGESHKSQA